LNGLRRIFRKVGSPTFLGSRRRAAVLIVGALALVSSAALAGRYVGSDNPAGATDDEQVAEPFDDQVTPGPNETPDTSQPFWYVPWSNLEANLPRYEQVVAGIRLGPGLHGGMACDGPTESVSAEVARGSAVDIAPGYLPEGAAAGEHDTEVCSGEAVFQEAVYYIEPDPDEMRLVSGGVMTFFEAQHGGAVDIMRIKLRVPEWDPSFPSERIEAGIVAGMPAAIGVPVLPEGWGTGFILAYDPATQVLTRVGGQDLTVAELRKIAEGLLK
jgi:hypothetical protein